MPGGGFSGVSVTITAGEHVVTAPEPVGVYAYGFRYYASYGYPAGVGSPMAFNQIRVIDTISTVGNDLDTSSFSMTPFSVTTFTNATTMEWRFDSLYVNQAQDISFTTILRNPVPGENRLVDQQLNVYYTDQAGNEISTGVGPQYVHVIQSAFTSSIATDKSAYQANENVVINAAITNLSEYERTIDATVLIEDNQGNLVTEVTTLSGLDFTIGETKEFNNIVFNTGITYPGDYRALLFLYDNQNQVGEAITSFTILPSEAITGTTEISCGIITDKISYNPNEIVVISGSVTNLSVKYPFVRRLHGDLRIEPVRRHYRRIFRINTIAHTQRVFLSEI